MASSGLFQPKGAGSRRRGESRAAAAIEGKAFAAKNRVITA
jgi:hypothetical protein